MFGLLDYIYLSKDELFSNLDIVVGAPYEDNMAGAVYVFDGSSKGPNQIFSQVSFLHFTCPKQTN